MALFNFHRVEQECAYFSKIQLLIFIGLLFSIGLSSCSAKQIPLTRAEEALLMSLSKVEGSEISLQYDYSAVTQHRTDGELIVMVSHEGNAAFCQTDSTTMQKKSAAMVYVLLPVLRFKQNHSQVVVMYSATSKPHNGSSDEI